MGYKMNLGSWNSIFAVPCAVVDDHIKLAGSAQLKVLLWFLRHAGQNVSIEEISKALAMHPADIKDAMQYWIENRIIENNSGELSPTKLTEHQSSKKVPTNETVIKNDIEQPPKKKQSKILRHQVPDTSYVVDRIASSKEFEALVHESEIILSRPVSNNDLAHFIMFHDDYGLPLDVILMILQYAVSVEKPNINYINKIALNWGEEEIDTIEKAEQKIRKLELSNKAWSTVEKIIGLDHRSPTLSESEMVNRWINDWGYSEILIKEAYDRCVDSKGKYIAKYMDGIIKKWHADEIYTIEQAIQERKNTKEKFNKRESRKPSYDIDKYEKTSMFDYEYI